MDRFTKEELEEVAHALRINVSRIFKRMHKYERRYVENNVTEIDTLLYKQRTERVEMLAGLVRKVEDYINIPLKEE